MLTFCSDFIIILQWSQIRAELGEQNKPLDDCTEKVLLSRDVLLANAHLGSLLLRGPKRWLAQQFKAFAATEVPNSVPSTQEMNWSPLLVPMSTACTHTLRHAVHTDKRIIKNKHQHSPVEFISDWTGNWWLGARPSPLHHSHEILLKSSSLSLPP